MNFIKENSAGYMTNFAARLFAKKMTERLAPEGLCVAYLPVIFVLMHELENGNLKGLTQKQLAISIDIEQPTMAATLSRMKRDGLIKTSPNPKDARSSLVCLTDLCVSKTGVVENAKNEINAVALAELTKTEHDMLLKLLCKVVKSLQSE
ncbi:MAG: MarR family winged helix-turn-helix transcriptional regulator [Nitratireductor sp.]